MLSTWYGLWRFCADEVLRDKVFNIVKNSKYDGYQCGIASLAYKFFDKNSSGCGVKNENMSNQEWAEVHKSIIRKFKKQKVYPSFKDNIWVLILPICNW